MKLKLIVPIIAFVAFFAGIISFHAFSQDSTGKKILYYTCSMHPSVKSDKPGNCPICGMNLEPVYGDSNATTNAPLPGTNNATATDNKPVPYPLDTCVVDGMKLDSMGGPYVFVYQGQEIKMCCANCKPVFMQNAGQYMKKIKDAEAAAKK